MLFLRGFQRMAGRLACCLCCFVSAFMASAETRLPREHQSLARDIFRELVEINTTHPFGSTAAAEAMAARLKGAGFEQVHVLGPKPAKANLVVRLTGTGKRRPVLFIAHLDVVEARKEDWTLDPFKLTEQQGYFYGRGTTDIKNEAADLVANFIRLKQEHYQPERDLILALTADEEAGGTDNGVDWLLREHRSLIEAEFCLNPDGGGGDIKAGRHTENPVQTAEKVYLSFQLLAKSKGGHSSEPTKDNPIYHLSAALARLAEFDFPIRVNETARAYFARLAETETGLLAEDMRAVGQSPTNTAAAARVCAASPTYNSMLRTTAVATQFNGGHADNALPQSAKAVVNCRILPEDSPDEVEATLRRILSDDQIEVTRMDEPRPSPPSPINLEVMRLVERITSEMWPGARVFPMMSAYATDGLYLRRAGIPVYGVSGVFNQADDWSRAHGRDERIPIESFYDAVEFTYRLMKAL